MTIPRRPPAGRLRPPVPAAVVLAIVVILGVLGTTGTPAHATHAGDQRPIHPGVRTRIGGARCTANFVFTDGADVYLGQAAHCATTERLGELTDGCRTGSLPLGTRVRIEGASRPGTLVYSSWLTMQDVGEQTRQACRFNDFALVRLAEQDESRVSPELPRAGGPSGLDVDGTIPGEPLYAFVGSRLDRARPDQPPRATSRGHSHDGWVHTIRAGFAPVRGDSGSPVVDASGDAVGALIYTDGDRRRSSNGVTDLNRALRYLHAAADPSNSLLDGTVIPVTSGGRFAPTPGGLAGLLFGRDGPACLHALVGLQ